MNNSYSDNCNTNLCHTSQTCQEYPRCYSHPKCTKHMAGSVIVREPNYSNYSNYTTNCATSPPTNCATNYQQALPPANIRVEDVKFNLPKARVAYKEPEAEVVWRQPEADVRLKPAQYEIKWEEPCNPGVLQNNCPETINTFSNYPSVKERKAYLENKCSEVKYNSTPCLSKYPINNCDDPITNCDEGGCTLTLPINTSHSIEGGYTNSTSQELSSSQVLLPQETRLGTSYQGNYINDLILNNCVNQVYPLKDVRDNYYLPIGLKNGVYNIFLYYNKNVKFYEIINILIVDGKITERYRITSTSKYTVKKINVKKESQENIIRFTYSDVVKEVDYKIINLVELDTAIISGMLDKKAFSLIPKESIEDMFHNCLFKR